MTVLHKNLSFEIVGAAFEVHRTLGTGFREKLYEAALECELTERRIPFKRQVPVSVSYKNNLIGSYWMDFVVDDRVVVELKACSEVTNALKVQARNYLAASGLRLAIILNFGKPSLESVRVVL